MLEPNVEMITKLHSLVLVASASPAAPHLLSLPTELRQKILSYLFVNASFRIQRQTSRLASDDVVGLKEPANIDWLDAFCASKEEPVLRVETGLCPSVLGHVLYVCRQLHEEARSVLAGMVVWEFWDGIRCNSVPSWMSG